MNPIGLFTGSLACKDEWESMIRHFASRVQSGSLAIEEGSAVNMMQSCITAVIPSYGYVLMMT
jgi:hypothetical protein